MKKIKHRNWFILKGEYENWQIKSGVEYRIDEQLQNFPGFGISIVFQIEKIRTKICQFSNLENSENF